MQQDKQIAKKLIVAAKAGDLTSLETLLDPGGDVDARDGDGATLLMLAAAKGKLPAVEWLVKRGADLDAADEYGGTAVFLALENGRDAVFLKLWELGADIAVQRRYGPDLLQLAISRGRLDWAERLLQSPKMDVNRIVGDYTALHTADDPAAVDFLLAQGADPHLQPETNQSPFVHAIKCGNADKIARLLPYVRRQTLAGWEGYRALCEACGGDDAELVTTLLELDAPPNPPEVFAEPPDNGWTPLAIATRGDKRAMAEVLLAHGAAVNPEGFMSTPLLHAVENKASACAALLLEKGARADAVDFFGKPAVHLAVEAQSARLLALLLDHGAAVDADALDAAWVLIVQSGRVDLASKLLARGPRIDVPLPRGDVTHLLPSRAAAAASVDALMGRLFGQEEGTSRRYDPDSRVGMTPLMLAAELDSPDMLAWLLEQGADIGARSENGCTALICAAFSDVHLQSVRRLLAMGADPRQADRGGWIPLFSASRGGAADCAQALLAAGADPLHADGEGYSTLMAAARGNCVELIPALLAAGVDPNAEWEGETALDMARKGGWDQAAALIEQAGGRPGSGSTDENGEDDDADLPREGYFQELAAQLKVCMPCLDEVALLATEVPVSFTNEYGYRITLLQWLADALSVQDLIEYREWKEYWGDWPDLAMLEGVDSGEYEPEAIHEILETLAGSGEAGWREPPYLEWMNHCLKPRGLRLMTFALENLYLLCVRDEDDQMDRLAELLAEGGIRVLSPEPLSLEECRARLRRGDG